MKKNLISKCILVIGLFSEFVHGEKLVDGIDVLDQGYLYEDLVTEKQRGAIYPEVILSGSYYSFHGRLRVIRKRLDQPFYPHFGLSYRHLNDDANLNHTARVTAGFEFLFENPTFIKPFFDLSQGYEIWRYWELGSLVDDSGSPFNESRVGLSVFFADNIRFFIFHQITGYWVRGPLKKNKDDLGTSRVRIATQYGFSMLL